MALRPKHFLPQSEPKPFQAAVIGLVPRPGQWWLLPRSCQRGPRARHCVGFHLRSAAPEALPLEQADQTFSIEVPPGGQSPLGPRALWLLHRRHHLRGVRTSSWPLKLTMACREVAPRGVPVFCAVGFHSGHQFIRQSTDFKCYYTREDAPPILWLVGCWLDAGFHRRNYFYGCKFTNGRNFRAWSLGFACWCGAFKLKSKTEIHASTERPFVQ